MFSAARYWHKAAVALEQSSRHRPMVRSKELGEAREIDIDSPAY